MKKCVLLAFLFCTSFQIQGMETAKDQSIQSISASYFNAVQQLRKITDTHMAALQVNGRDYSELVLPEISYLRELAHNDGTSLESAFRQSVKVINKTYSKPPKMLAINDGETIQLPKMSNTPLGRASRKTEEEKAQEIEQLRSEYHEASQLISGFYDELADCLNTRNDTYVVLYFNLKDLQYALANPLDPNNSQAIFAHFQGVKSSLVELKGTLETTKEENGEENGLAFQKDMVTFKETIEVVGTPYPFQYTLSAEFLTEKLNNDLEPVEKNIMAAGQAIENSLER